MPRAPFHYGSAKLKDGGDGISERLVNVWRGNFYVACYTSSLRRISAGVSPALGSWLGAMGRALSLSQTLNLTSTTLCLGFILFSLYFGKLLYLFEIQFLHVSNGAENLFENQMGYTCVCAHVCVYTHRQAQSWSHGGLTSDLLTMGWCEYDAC